MSVIYEHIGSTWELIEPFDRANNKTKEDDLLDGEIEFDVCQEFAHIVEWDGDPPAIIKLSNEEIRLLNNDFVAFRGSDDTPDIRKRYREKCFLWVITEKSLIIAREKIRNEKRFHDSDYICHTNLTKAGKAYVAGEALFGINGTVYINHFSDRYGGHNTPTELWEAVTVVFKKLGYTDLVDILELL